VVLEAQNPNNITTLTAPTMNQQLWGPAQHSWVTS